MFTELTEEEKNLVAPEIAGHMDKILVKFQNKFWYVKKLRPPEHKKPDYLGWLIGHTLVNVAEVKLLSPEEVEQLVLLPAISPIGSTISSENTYLVRLANSYTFDELVLKTNDEAIAYELVYSVWIRRRDAHAQNRVYIQGVPIFFDHQTAFLGERDLSDINTFFHEPPSDWGRGSAWRIVIRDVDMKTNDGRADPVLHAAQFVHNIDDFLNNLTIASNKIKEINIPGLTEAIRSASFTDSETQERLEFLKNNQETITEDLVKLKQILFKPFNFWSWISFG